MDDVANIIQVTMMMVANVLVMMLVNMLVMVVANVPLPTKDFDFVQTVCQLLQSLTFSNTPGGA